MKVFLFSDNKRVTRAFNSIHRSTQFHIEQHPLADLRTILKQNSREEFHYIDLSGMSGEQRDKSLRYLQKINAASYGIIDPEGSIHDPAALFHEGAIDYIGPALLKEGVYTKRLKKIRDAYSIGGESRARQAEQESEYIYSGSDWKGIKQGKEYTFCFMYTELDLHSDWKKKSGKLHLDKVGTDFHNFIERWVTPINGRIWMWEQFGGLVLFPFDGTNCEALLTCFKLMLNRTIISTEEFSYDILLSYRIALDIGNTVYKKRGETGTVISDTVNFLFHLGKRFADPGKLYLTDNVAAFIPSGLRDYFVPAGDFEGKTLQRMRLPVTA